MEEVAKQCYEDFQERLKIETQGEGIDLILDHVGFDTVMKGLKSLKKGRQIDNIRCDKRKRGSNRT